MFERQNIGDDDDRKRRGSSQQRDEPVVRWPAVSAAIAEVQLAAAGDARVRPSGVTFRHERGNAFRTIVTYRQVWIEAVLNWNESNHCRQARQHGSVVVAFGA